MSPTPRPESPIPHCCLTVEKELHLHFILSPRRIKALLLQETMEIRHRQENPSEDIEKNRVRLLTHVCNKHFSRLGIGQQTFQKPAYHRDPPAMQFLVFVEEELCRGVVYHKVPGTFPYFPRNPHGQEQGYGSSG